MKWSKCSMLDAANWARGRDATAYQAEHLPDWSAASVVFTDGSAIACLSRWCGPYSEVTPDVDADPPQFWIGTP